MQTLPTRMSNKEKVQMFGSLSTMLRAGIPILQALTTLAEEAKHNQKKILDVMIADLQGGIMVNESFSKFPNTFNKVTVNLIKAAEEAGTLEIALKDAKDSLQKEMEFEDKVKSALTYPAFVMMIFVGVMIMMLVFVMPRISQVFSRLKMELPITTKIMIGSSNFLMKHTIEVVVGTVVIVALLVTLYKLKRSFFTGLLSALPGISGLMSLINLTRFARSMTLLLGSGIPIVGALELSEDVITQPDLKKLLHQAREKVAGGKRFSEGLASHRKIIPGIVIKLIEVGEQTGTLHESMKDITEMLDYEVTKKLHSTTTLLEPVMLVFVALAVGGMMLSIIGPMYGLISNVTGR